MGCHDKVNCTALVRANPYVHVRHVCMACHGTTCTYMHIRRHTYMHTHKYIYPHAHARIYTQIYTRANAFTHKHTFAQIHIHTYAHTGCTSNQKTQTLCTNTHSHKNKCTHTHIHTYRVHKQPEDSDLVHKLCEHSEGVRSCPRQASYGEYGGRTRFCRHHKGPDDVLSRLSSKWKMARGVVKSALAAGSGSRNNKVGADRGLGVPSTSMLLRSAVRRNATAAAMLADTNMMHMNALLLQSPRALRQHANMVRASALANGCMDTADACMDTGDAQSGGMIQAHDEQQRHADGTQMQTDISVMAPQIHVMQAQISAYSTCTSDARALPLRRGDVAAAPPNGLLHVTQQHLHQHQHQHQHQQDHVGLHQHAADPCVTCGRDGAKVITPPPTESFYFCMNTPWWSPGVLPTLTAYASSSSYASTSSSSSSYVNGHTGTITVAPSQAGNSVHRLNHDRSAYEHAGTGPPPGLNNVVNRLSHGHDAWDVGPGWPGAQQVPGHWMPDAGGQLMYGMPQCVPQTYVQGGPGA